MKKPRSTPRLTKTTFTVPADIWVQLKKLTGDKTSRGFAPIVGKSGVRFSRDRYISGLLEGELARLKDLPINSDAAFRSLQKEAREQLLNEPQSFMKVNLSLEGSVAERFASIADTKRIPRSPLMSCFLALVLRGLLRAQRIVLDPTNDEWSFDSLEEQYGDLFLSDEDLAERREADLVIFALAKLKRASIVDTERAYWALPPARRRKLRASSKVRDAIRTHRKEWQCRKDTPVDLDQFLPPSMRLRKPR